MSNDNLQQKYEEILAMTKRIADQLRLLQTPIDFDQLERDGIVLKEGNAYHVPNTEKLPEHVAAKIDSVEIRNGKSYVKFMPQGTKVDELVKQFEKLGF